MASKILHSSRRRAAPATIARRIKITQSIARHLSSLLKANGIVNYFFPSPISSTRRWSTKAGFGHQRQHATSKFVNSFSVPCDNVWGWALFCDRKWFTSPYALVNYCFARAVKNLIILYLINTRLKMYNFPTRGRIKNWERSLPEQCCRWHTILWMSNKLISVDGGV